VGLLTGRYPLRAGQPNNFGPDSTNGLRTSEILLPQLLKQRGYKTMAIGKWHLGHAAPEYMPTSRGFDQYFGLLYSNDMIQPWVKTNHPLELHRDLKPVETVTGQSNLTERYTEEAVKFIRASAGAPFLLYLPYAMPHLPISASSRKGTSRAGLYGDVIETIDWSAGEILKTLKQLKIDNDTMVVFCSDNGPWLDLPSRMLQKGNEPWHTGTKSLLRGSKGGTWEGGPRVPGIVRWPGTIPAGQVTADMASTLDLLPTICRLAGAELPKDRTYDGFDIMPALQGRAASPRQTFFYFRGPMLEGVREGKWKYRFARTFHEERKDTAPLVPELYDLDADPAEQYNLYERHGDVAERLRAKLAAMAAELKAELPS
jgi:arylsulfatase A-like enzyme